MESGLLVLGSLLAVLIRWTVSLFPYSGQGKPPMFGDYEAQRHWMEVTFHLPVEKWYGEAPGNNLNYWGLDYPPLTAYHSQVYGCIANSINSSWVALVTSHGHESYSHKLFMRYSVLAVDLLIFFTATIYYFYKSKYKDQAKACAAVCTLLYPGLILIDHGHFQYNCVSLGLLVWAVAALSRGHDFLGAATFCLALNYKQMELYHALPFFCYLLGTCWKRNISSLGFIKLIKLGIVVIVTFAIIWWPFISGGRDVVYQVVQRLFPFNRGLFEDKVANVWCSISVFVKLKQLIPDHLVQLCAAVTFLANVPCCLNLILKPSFQRFQYALINSSLIFFLLSYQVHEKSILLVAIPVCLILPRQPLLSLWFLLISTFSMFPLLFKDGLLIPLVATTVIHLLITIHAFVQKDNSFVQVFQYKVPMSYLCSASVQGALLLCLASFALEPPAKYPDLYPVLCAQYSCAHFLMFAWIFHRTQFWGLDDGYKQKRN